MFCCWVLIKYVLLLKDFAIRWPEFACCWSATSLSMWIFCGCFYIHFAEVDYLPCFCLDQCPGRKVLIVTWRQILNCDMIRESMHMGDRGRAYTYVCAYMCALGHACLCACGCSHVHVCACIIKIFNCILTIACTCT